MKHISKKKRGNKRFHKRKSNEKNMRSPLTITLIVLILFAILIVFSVFNGPIKKQEINDIEPANETGIINEEINEQIPESMESSSIRTNRAISSGDISKCENDGECRISFIFDKAKKSGNTGDCNEIENIEVRDNCKDNVLLSNSIQTGDKSLCNQIQDVSIRTLCGGI